MYILFKRRHPRHAYKHVEKLLFTQFHDAVTETCIAEAYEDICDIYGEVLNEGNIILNNALQALASKIDTRGMEYPS